MILAAANAPVLTVTRLGVAEALPFIVHVTVVHLCRFSWSLSGGLRSPLPAEALPCRSRLPARVSRTASLILLLQLQKSQGTFRLPIVRSHAPWASHGLHTLAEKRKSEAVENRVEHGSARRGILFNVFAKHNSASPCIQNEELPLKL